MGSNSPSVIVRLKYYEPESEGRDFYSSLKKDDYLNYVDKGIRDDGRRKPSSYLDYADDKEKSSGVFNQNGLISPKEKKDLREKLRKTKSCIWDCVISFEEEYGKKNCRTPEKAKELLVKVLPRFFKSIGLDPEKTEWYAGLHQNTDNRHIHLSFFQLEPTLFDRKTKGRKYRYGKIPLKAVNDFKMSIADHYSAPVEGISRIRSLLLEETKRTVSESFSNQRESIGYLLQEVYRKLPEKGSLAYESENMAPLRKDLDALSDQIMAHESIRKPYEELMKKAKKKDEETSRECHFQKIDPTPYLLAPKIEKDFRRRSGNAIVKELLKRKREEREKTARFHHPKAIQRERNRTLHSFLNDALFYADRAAEEQQIALQEWERNLERIEEGEDEQEEEMEM